MFIQKKRIVADTEPDMGGANVAPEATDLLFEAEDVAELVAEITGETVDVIADGDQVVFTVGEDEYTVEAEGGEEVLEAVRRNFRGKSGVSASTNRTHRNTGRPVRKLPNKR